MSGFATLNSHSSHAIVAHRSKITTAFARNQQLAAKVDEFLRTYPNSATVSLFEDIAAYISTLEEAVRSSQSVQQDVPAPVSKKRKLDGSAADAAGLAPGHWSDRSVQPDFVVPDVSFSVPQRKKLRLEASAAKSGWLRAVNGEGNVEFGVAWESVEQAFCLPVPEKAKKQYNFVIVPRGADGLSSNTNAPECIVWTVNESAPSEEGRADAEPANTARFLSAQLARFGKEVVLPDDEEFVSAMPTLKKDDKAYHVKAHRGSKDGFLFFLPPGILWAFKKPLLFLPFAAITSVSYTSVLQRTFNLNVSVTAAVPQPDAAAPPAEQEVEFSMIDQADYAGIDAYVKRHALNDASLAAARRAKLYNVNKPRDANANANAANGSAASAAGGPGAQEEEGEEEESELQKAERLLQDEEDELEEDYVDDGESEAGSSEEEDYGDGEDGQDAGAEQGGGEGAFEEEEEYEEEQGGYEDEEDG